MNRDEQMKLDTGGRNVLLLTVFLGLLAAMAPLATDMYLPSLPAMSGEFNAPASMVQLTLTMTMVGMAVGQIVIGPLSDKLGRKVPLIVGMGIFGLASLGCVFTTNINAFLVCRLIQGAAGAAGVVVARAVARDIAKGPALTKLFAMLMMVNGLAPILAPVIGGQLLLFSSWRMIFVVLAGVGFILAVCAMLFKESLPSENRVSSIGGSFKSFKQMLSGKYFLGHCLMQCFSFGAFFAYISGSSFAFQNVYGVSAQAYSFIFGFLGVCIGIAGAVPARVAGRVSDVSLLRWSLIQALVGSILVFIVCWFELPVYALGLALVVCISMISIFSSASFSLAMQTQGKNAGSASALLGFFSMISGGIMAPLVGIAGDHTAIPMAVIMMICEAGSLVVFYTMIRPYHIREAKMKKVAAEA